MSEERHLPHKSEQQRPAHSVSSENMEDWRVYSKAVNTRMLVGKLIFHINDFGKSLNFRAAQVTPEELTNYKKWVDEEYELVRKEMEAVLPETKQKPETVFAAYDLISTKMDDLVASYIETSPGLKTGQKEDKLREIYQLSKNLHKCVSDSCKSTWAECLYRDQDWFKECQRNTPHLIPVPSEIESQEQPKPLQDTMAEAGAALPKGYENFVLPKVAPVRISLNESDTEDSGSDSENPDVVRRRRVMPPKKQPIVAPVSSASLVSDSAAS